MDWRKLGDQLSVDGLLRDIHVPGVTLADWRRLFDILRMSEPQPVYMLDGDGHPLPGTIEEIFDSRSHASPMLSVRRDKLTFNCHFFVQEEIEFNLDPREIAGIGDLKTVLDFMEFLGRTTGKTVLLTPENMPETPILQHLPDTGRIIWGSG